MKITKESKYTVEFSEEEMCQVCYLLELGSDLMISKTYSSTSVKVFVKPTNYDFVKHHILKEANFKLNEFDVITAKLKHKLYNG